MLIACTWPFLALIAGTDVVFQGEKEGTEAR